MILAEMRNYTNRKVETALATITAAVMENPTALVTSTVMEIKGSLHSLNPAAELGVSLQRRESKSQSSHLPPLATKERAEETELSNQKQTCVANLEQQLQEQQQDLQQLQAELRNQSRLVRSSKNSSSKIQTGCWERLLHFLTQPPPQKPVTAVLQQYAQPAGRASERAHYGVEGGVRASRG